MPITYEYSGETGIIFITCSGSVTRKELVENFAAIRLEGPVVNAAPRFIDLSLATEIDLDFESMRVLLRETENVAREEGSHVTAVFLAPTDVPYGVARIYETLASDSQYLDVAVFRTKPEVRAWFCDRGFNLPDDD